MSVAVDPDVAARPDPPSRWSAPIGAGLALIGLLFLGLAISLWFQSSPGWGYDFRAYFEAALRLLATGTPYQAETLGGPFRPGPFGLYMYSPPLAVLFAPLTQLGEQTAILVWLGVRLALLVLTCALMPVSRPIRLATFGVAALSAPVLIDLTLGNVSLIVTFFAVVTWRWLDKPIGSLAIAASLTLRPTMALVCGWWLLRGLWRPVAWTVGAFLVLAVLTLPFVGLDRWTEYLTVLRNVSDVTGVFKNVDLGSAVLLFGGSAQLASISLFAGYAVALGAVVFSLRRDRELSYVVTVSATLLLSPLLWDHYLTNLLVPAAFLVSRGRRWGLALPLLCWLPMLVEAVLPASRDAAYGLLAFVALAGLLLPFAAPARGEPAGLFLERLGRRTATRPARA